MKQMALIMLKCGVLILPTGLDQTRIELVFQHKRGGDKIGIHIRTTGRNVRGSCLRNSADAVVALRGFVDAEPEPIRRKISR